MGNCVAKTLRFYVCVWKAIKNSSVPVHIVKTPRPATEPRDGPTRNFHEKYRKNTPRAEILEPQEIPQKNRKNTQNAHFWYSGGIFLVFSGYFGGKFWESRISGRGVFFRYFSGKFRVGPFRGSVAGWAVLNHIAHFMVYAPLIDAIGYSAIEGPKPSEPLRPLVCALFIRFFLSMFLLY